MPRLVDVQHGFARQPREQFGVGRGQGPAHLGDQLGQVAAGNVHARHVAEKLADGGERGVADALHKGDQGRQPRAEQPRLDHGVRQRRVMELLAVGAPVGQASMLGDDRRCFGDFDLLQHVGRTLGQPKRTATVGATIQGVRLDMLDSLGREDRSQVLWMSWLGAAFSFLSVLGRRPRRLDYIAGGRFGRVRGVLLGFGQFRLQRDNALQQRCGGLGHCFRNHSVYVPASENSCHAPS